MSYIWNTQTAGRFVWMLQVISAEPPFLCQATCVETSSAKCNGPLSFIIILPSFYIYENLHFFQRLINNILARGLGCLLLLCSIFRTYAQLTWHIKPLCKIEIKPNLLDSVVLNTFIQGFCPFVRRSNPWRWVDFCLYKFAIWTACHLDDITSLTT